MAIIGFNKIFNRLHNFFNFKIFLDFSTEFFRRKSDAIRGYNCFNIFRSNCSFMGRY